MRATQLVTSLDTRLKTEQVHPHNLRHNLAHTLGLTPSHIKRHTTPHIQHQATPKTTLRVSKTPHTRRVPIAKCVVLWAFWWCTPVCRLPHPPPRHKV